MADPADPAAGCELVLILGGDGSILRGAELSRGTGVLILGINLGHVAFWPRPTPRRSAPRWDRIGRGLRLVEERLALQVRALRGGEQVFSSWALNEVTVEKASRERMIELDRRDRRSSPLHLGLRRPRHATPTGSTAYAFWAGGPIVAGRRSPARAVSAHALFARPVVVGPVPVGGRDPPACRRTRRGVV